MPLKHKVRSMICAPKGHLLLQADFSQGESWIVAHLANDDNFKRFISKGDVHSETGYAIKYSGTGHIPCAEHKWVPNELDGKSCRQCNAILDKEERTTGKRSNHGFSYRMSYLRAAQIWTTEGVRITNERVKEIREIWLGLYPGIPNWWRDIEWKLKQFNNTLRTTYGRECTFYGFQGDELYKEATAYEPQSTLADHANGVVHPELGIRGGFLEVDRLLGDGKPCWLLNASHDSVLLEVPDSEVNEVAPRVRDILQRPLIINGEMFTIPVDIEIGERWSDGMKGWKEAA